MSIRHKKKKKISFFYQKTPSHFPQNVLTNKKFVKAFRRVYQDAFSSFYKEKRTRVSFFLIIFTNKVTQ